MLFASSLQPFQQTLIRYQVSDQYQDDRFLIQSFMQLGFIETSLALLKSIATDIQVGPKIIVVSCCI